MTFVEEVGESGGEDYREAKRSARDPRIAVRAEAARRTDIAPEFLYFLATDSARGVRAAVAANPATPRQADRLLADDPSAAIRRRVAVKSADVLPRNDAPDPGPPDRALVDLLEMAAADRSVAVRGAVSERLADLDHAPAGIVRRLAADPDERVAGAVLERSRQLAESDLDAMLAEPPSPGARAAIARRETLSAALADRLARTDDIGAIAILLANHGAQIREDTLDHLLDRAPRHEGWHRPLVDRPSLPARAVERLSSFIALPLLEALRRRPDLDAGLRHFVAARAETAKENAKAGLSAETLDAPPTDERVEGAIFGRDRTFVVAALSRRSGLARPLVARILGSGSAKGIVSLAWKATLPVGLAVKLQAHIGNLPGRAMLPARDGTAYPLTEAEMVWQLEFFAGR